MVYWFLIIFFLDVLASNVGLAITQAFGLTSLLQWSIRKLAEVENYMTSVERVVEYSTSKMEPTGGNQIFDFPNKGKIEFRNVSLRYASNSNRALNNLNFLVQPEDKVGIIGRTGAGKSSIISALFRLYDIDGQIIIDDCDIKTLNVGMLRKRLSIIPQDPSLFNGTIRTNLDPNDEFSDHELWKVLETVHLTNLNLNDLITNGGSNYSVGQKQLICLAKALLTKN